ncbi:hypothetical protein [Kitasatospora camelliae]|uniref:Uncharacterized protein n=1 Tax=Kitasatospora camelliae TaxID=3156397 RepID=A0AAU8K2M1_9ACTN
MPKTARELIERAFHVSFKLPHQAAELLDGHRVENRREAFADAANLIRSLPAPPEAGPDWHWYTFALNRAADRLDQLAKEQQ